MTVPQTEKRGGEKTFGGKDYKLCVGHAEVERTMGTFQGLSLNQQLDM